MPDRRYMHNDKQDEALQLLADAGVLLTSSLDLHQTLENLAHLVVPRLADWCVIDLLDEDTEHEGAMRRFTVVHHDPEHEHEARILREPGPLFRGDPGGSSHVITTGESIFLPYATPELLDQRIANNVTCDIYKRLEINALIIVPLMAKGHIFGAMHFAVSSAERAYTASDLLIAQDLGTRAGLAIDNARTFAGAQRVAEELREANRSKDEFLGLISHELRTPITVIHGGARILRLRGNQLQPSRRDDLIADIESESERLHQMIENLLALSRAELRAEFEPEPILLQRVLSQVVTAYRRQRRGRDIELSVPEDLPPVAADQGYVEQIVGNLLSNADKYSEVGRQIEVRVSRAGEDHATVAVLDHGEGVPEDELDRLFERFYRSQRTATTVSGVGMGLTVCRRLIELMSGEIHATARETGGLMVEFTLPFYVQFEEAPS